MVNNIFGTTIRDFRKKLGYSQRELAHKVGVSFTYISKIENGIMPPPKERVIRKFAEVLNTDIDELLILAGKLPADITEMLKNQKTVQLLRSNHMQKRIGIAGDKSGIDKMKSLFNYKKLSRVALPIILVLAVASSLWYAAPTPVRALSITISPPAAGTLGTTHSFSVVVSLPNPDLIPIQSITMEIYNEADPSSYTATLNNLPVSDGGTASGSGISVTASTTNLAYFSGTGYAYWQGTGYFFGSGYGYGYQYSGTGSITYTGTWTSPAGWPAGSYKVKVSVVAVGPDLSKTFTQTSSTFTLSAPVVPPPSGGGGAGIAGAFIIEPGVVDVAGVVTSTGKFKLDVEIKSADSKVGLSIDEGTFGLIKNGDPITKITVLEMADPPAPPADASIIGLTYNLGPDDATFDPPITLTFTYESGDIPEGMDEEDLVIAMWDEDSGEWVVLEGATVDPVTRTVSAPVIHFTAFAIIARVTPEPEVVVVEPEEPVVESEEPVVEPEEPVTEPEEPVTESEEPMTEPEEPAEDLDRQPADFPTGALPEEPVAGISWWIWGVIAVVVVAVAAGSFMWWRRRLG